jgi:hypothetical protein
MSSTVRHFVPAEFTGSTSRLDADCSTISTTTVATPSSADSTLPLARRCTSSPGVTNTTRQPEPSAGRSAAGGGADASSPSLLSAADAPAAARFAARFFLSRAARSTAQRADSSKCSAMTRSRRFSGVPSANAATMCPGLYE